MSIREKDLAGTPANGGRFASPQHSDTDLPTLVAVADEQPATAQLIGKYGTWEVPAKSLEMARAVEKALENVPDWRRADKAMDWAQAQGYDHAAEDNYRGADNAHGHGAVIVSEDEICIALSGHGQRNFEVDLDGDSGTMSDGDDDGRMDMRVFIFSG